MISVQSLVPLILAADELPTRGSASEWQLAIGLGIAALLCLLVVTFTTKAGIIARATTKEAVRQPVFLLCLALAIVIQLINTVLPFFSLGDDLKMLKDCSLATILISGLLVAVWTASTSIAEEIEGKTAMTLLSKPINRRQFILGKYIGILQTVLIYMIPVVIVFLLSISYRTGYDAKDLSKDSPEIAERLIEMQQVAPGLALLFMEIAILSSVSVAISTRLPMVVNLTTCFTIFVVGHLAGVLVGAGKGRLEFVGFMARLIATVLPGLENFNISAAIATGDLVPPVYLGSAAIYCICYSTAMILLSFILFEDRDLA